MSRLGGRNTLGERRGDARGGRGRVARSKQRALWPRMARERCRGAPLPSMLVAHLDARCLACGKAARQAQTMAQLDWRPPEGRQPLG
eukprot:4000741-Alexandrium_andersonii.AAC.1